jgi:hypothetical protein
LQNIFIVTIGAVYAYNRRMRKFNCNGGRYRCSPNVPHSVSGAIIVYVIYNAALLQQQWYGHWIRWILKKKSAHALCCFLIYQAINIYIKYLCCEYQRIWTFNKWFIRGLVLASQIQAHVHARVGWHFFVTPIYR